MAGTEVRAVVEAILTAFGNGMNIFQRMQSAKSTTRCKSKPPGTDDIQVHESLKRRPCEIRERYNLSVATHGKSFETGDAVCQSRLAQTLLALNTGLIEIINTALSKGSKARNLGRQSMLMLSEVAAIDTLSALTQLDDRLLSTSAVALRATDYQRRRERKSSRSETKVNDKNPTATLIDDEKQLLLERGGWVKTKSGLLIAVTPEEARKRAIQRSERKRSRSALSTTAKQSGPRSGGKTAVNRSGRSPENPSQSRPRPLRDSSDPASRIVHDLQPGPPAYEALKAPSVLVVPIDYFDTREVVAELPPPRPPKIPLHQSHIRPNPKVRSRPISSATFMTASTKIGEIPEHRQADRMLLEAERERRPLPYAIPPALLSNDTKKKRKGFWPWKRRMPDRTLVT